MAFSESYLIPKTTFEKLKRWRQKIPPDVELKMLDHRTRFALPTTKKEPPNSQMKTILDSVKEPAKKVLAKKILNFISTRAGGSIRWEDDYKIIIDGEKNYHLDIRDAILDLVGETADTNGKTLGLYQKLKQLKTPFHYLQFYDVAQEEAKLDRIKSQAKMEEMVEKVLEKKFQDYNDYSYEEEESSPEEREEYSFIKPEVVGHLKPDLDATVSGLGDEAFTMSPIIHGLPKRMASKKTSTPKKTHRMQLRNQKWINYR